MSNALFFASPVVAGLLLGILLGGSVRRVQPLPSSALALVVVAAALQYVDYRQPAVRAWVDDQLHVPLRVPVYVACLAALAAVVLRRDSRVAAAALLVVVIGGLANFAVITANGGMPASAAAQRSAGVSAETLRKAALSPKHLAAGEDVRLYVLGDVIPVRPLHTVISAGDVAIAVGIAAFVAAEMRPQGRRRRFGARHPVPTPAA